MNSDVEKRAGYRHLHICRESVCMRERGYYTCVACTEREKKNEQQLLIEGDCCCTACVRLQNQLILVEKYSLLWRPHMCTHTHIYEHTTGLLLESKLESGSTKEVLQRPAESANCLRDASPSFYNTAIQERYLTVK